MEAGDALIGTCSWNYPSWVGLVYSRPSPTAAGYLREYARRFRTAEIDSWFYKVPERREVLDYLDAAGGDLRFTVKVPEEISLTHRRGRGPSGLVPNPGFLSRSLFARFLDRIEPMLPRVDALMLEFEYLSREKMGSARAFMDALGAFAEGMPPGLPLAVETRNKDYLSGEYFGFLRSRGLAHVFSEKIYMPHVYEVFERFPESASGTSVIRLLGGDRREMEARTGEKWDRIVEERPDKERIARMSREIQYRGGKLVININNHYEGSAPLTALFFERALGIREP